MSQLKELAYSDETAIIVKVIIAIQAIVIIIAKEKQAAPRVAFPWFAKLRKNLTTVSFLLLLNFIAIKLPSWKDV